MIVEYSALPPLIQPLLGGQPVTEEGERKTREAREKEEGVLVEADKREVR